MRGKREPIEIRFWRFVDKTDGCWLWTGGGQPNKGYGYFGIASGRSVLAHRMSYRLAYGDIPDGMWVLHRCDVRRCVNPAHLFLGDRADNMRDAANKGRCNFQQDPSIVRRGEAHYKARLTQSSVDEIRRRYCAGEKQRKLAAEFGVSQATISCVVNYLQWVA